uniref:Uncharacterized protein LOC100180169 n=1 Tax=Phallusia mammillata TaxID=59560 RepID=A0A6F9DHW9_9ASCI|nr:uncharacterized protein LOC100180169 [Phallusia mammillata]
MDCVDVVIGSVKDSLHRVQDMYTRDRSTPRADNFYGGSDDITGSAGSQVDGFTTIAFRKRLQATHGSDHPIENLLTHVIWAMGQSIDQYFHSPRSGLESCTASDYRFYRHDEIKYHGSGSQRRGVVNMNFYENPNPAPTGQCTSVSHEYKQPSTCTSEGDNFDCDYYASWTLNTETDVIDFVLKSKQTRDRWIALGISDDRLMPNSDAIVGFIDNQERAVISDRWITMRSNPPLDDTADNLSNKRGSYQNGVLTIEFSRARDTQDTRDIPFTDTSCPFMFYANGPTSNNNNNINYHDSKIVSTNGVCVRACAVQTVVENTLAGQVRLTARTFTDELADSSTQEYRNLKTEMETTIATAYRQANFVKESVSDVLVTVTGFSAGSVVVNYNLTVTHSDESISEDQLATALEQALKEVIAENNGTLGGASDTSVDSVSISSASSGDAATTIAPTTSAPTTSAPTGLKDWEIAVICVCVMGAVTIAAAAAAACIRKKNAQKNFQAIPMKTDNSNSEGHHNPIVNEYENFKERPSPSSSVHDTDSEKEKSLKPEQVV